VAVSLDIWETGPENLVYRLTKENRYVVQESVESIAEYRYQLDAAPGAKKRVAGALSRQLKRTKNPVKWPQEHHFRHLPLTTADAKIALSVVQVKLEPQDVVFCSPCEAPISATPAIGCAKQEMPRRPRVFEDGDSEISICQRQFPIAETALEQARTIPEASPNSARPQGAEAVQTLCMPVQVVDNVALGFTHSQAPPFDITLDWA
jgi:hypothetical protein